MVLKIMTHTWEMYAMSSDLQRFIICWIQRHNISDDIQYVFDLLSTLATLSSLKCCLGVASYDNKNNKFKAL